MASPSTPVAVLADAAAGRDEALPSGARCGGFEIVRVIGTGGFGIVYLARDPALGREVAIKEYMPRRLATRDAARRVVLREGARADALVDGLRAFTAEARLLARFDHPSLVRVYRV